MRLGGQTVGVLGFGFNYMYPREHQDLMRRMLRNGQTLISEFAPDVPPRPGNFPRRNRIVSGMSLGVLVTEAASKSGSKITARLAAEQGREVFTVPGPFDSIYSEGTKELVNLGAKLVTSIDDILEEIAI
jgi:DNA processing protein